MQLDDKMYIVGQQVFHVIVLHILLDSFLQLLGVLSGHLPEMTRLGPVVLFLSQILILFNKLIVLLGEARRLRVLQVVRVVFWGVVWRRN